MQRGAALKLRDDELGARLAPMALDLLRDSQRLKLMARQAAALARPQAAEAIVDELLRLGAFYD